MRKTMLLIILVLVLISLGCTNQRKSISDIDSDSILDYNDECPNRYGLESNDGCPVITNNDKDGDGTPDSSDKCPTLSGHPSNRACPYGDYDQDGVDNINDDCPTKYGSMRNEGCPSVGNEPSECEAGKTIEECIYGDIE